VQVSRELVTAVVELVKDDYLVLSLPKHNQAVGFAAVTDFNLQNQEGRSPFKLGQQVQARIAALPSAETGTGTNACTHAHTHNSLCKAGAMLTSLFSICMIGHNGQLQPFPPTRMHSKASVRQIQ